MNLENPAKFLYLTGIFSCGGESLGIRITVWNGTYNIDGSTIPTILREGAGNLVPKFGAYVKVPSSLSETIASNEGHANINQLFAECSESLDNYRFGRVCGGQWTRDIQYIAKGKNFIDPIKSSFSVEKGKRHSHPSFEPVLLHSIFCLRSGFDHSA
jgi:hypothetical protein